MKLKTTKAPESRQNALAAVLAAVPERLRDTARRGKRLAPALLSTVLKAVRCRFYRRLPKRGFKNPFAKEFAVVNLDTIQKAIDAGKLNADAINIESLMNSGIVNKQLDGVRLLARGALTSKVAISVNSASKAAVEAVEKAGGKVTIVEA